MADNQAVEALIRLGLDKQQAEDNVNELKRMGLEISSIEDKTKRSTDALKKMIETGRQMREVGIVAAAAGAAILAPFIAAANEYVKRYKGLEQTANDYTAAQQRQANATAALGRVAAQELIPVMNQVADFQEKVAAFAQAHPELVGAAIGGGAALVAGGGALIAAGTAVTTIARAAELLKGVANSDFAKNLAGTALTLGAVVVAAKATEAGLQEYGKSVGDARLAAFQLSDALKPLREVVSVALLELASAFVEGKKDFLLFIVTLGQLGPMLKIAFDNMLDQIATSFRELKPRLEILLNSIHDGFADFFNGFIKWANDNLHTNLQTMGHVAYKDGTLTPEQQIQQEEAFLKARQAGRQMTDLGTTLSASQSVKDIQTQYDTDKANLAKIADSLSKFAETGTLGSAADKFISNISSSIKGAFSGVTGTSGSGFTATTNGVPGLSPEAVNAYIDFRKQQTAADLNYTNEAKKISTDFDNSEKKARADHAVEMLKIAQEQSNAESDLALKFQQDQTKATRDFQFNETEIQKKAQFERQQQERAHLYNLGKFAADRDVAGFVEAQMQHTFEQQQQKRQDDFDKQQRQDQFDHEQQDKALQYQIDLDNLKLQGKRKQDEANAQFKQEESDRQQAYQNQLTDLKTKHDNENTLLQQHFAETLAGLQDNVDGLKTIHDTYYAQETAAAQQYVDNNKAILQQLYSMSLGVPNSGSSSTTTNTSGIYNPSVAVSSGTTYSNYHQAAPPPSYNTNPNNFAGYNPNVTVHVNNPQFGQIATPQDVQSGMNTVMDAVTTALGGGR